jgi:plasmid maintenance system antidote protein VapI
MSDLFVTKYYFRQRQLNRLYNVVLQAIIESGIGQKHIADKLRISVVEVSELLSGPENWTNDTASDLLFTIGAELDFHVVALPWLKPVQGE